MIINFNYKKHRFNDDNLKSMSVMEKKDSKYNSKPSLRYNRNGSLLQNWGENKSHLYTHNDIIVLRSTEE